jgi:phytoene synthase
MDPVRNAATSPESVSVIPRDPAALDDAGTYDARACRLIAAKHARTFSIASKLLPREKRRGAYAIYATCRTADDIVDASGLYPEEGALSLRRFRDEVFSALEQPADDPILRELARAVRDFNVPVEAMRELFDGVERDLSDHEYETWPDLEEYCEGVAGSVGEMCCAIFGVASENAGKASIAVGCARKLGVAMQLTNILRDVGEDAARGRCYLPVDELERYGLDYERVLSGTVRLDWDAWRAFMAFQVGRARDLYRQALPGIPLLEVDAQGCALACAAGYSKILEAIEESHFDTLSHRVSASRMTLLGVAWRSWRGDLPRLAADLSFPFDPARQAPR